MTGLDLIALQSILKTNANNIFPAMLSIKMAKLKQEVEEGIDIYKEALLRLVKNYGQLKEDGSPNIDSEGNILLKPDCVDNWKKESQELEKAQVKDCTIKFTQEEVEQLSLTPIEAEALLKLM